MPEVGARRACACGLFFLSRIELSVGAGIINSLGTGTVAKMGLDLVRYHTVPTWVT